MVPCNFSRHTLKLYKGPDLDQKKGILGLVSRGFGVNCGRGTFFGGASGFSIRNY